ncbi:UNVERIFIED_CONTAM: Phosphate transporter [Sesamum radiatum]|uniref:Phosphate transporter n=1 Tax=Sesamum radiatum TaxID=300843 RepID=A0AAW2VAV4_SESRA
MKFSKQFEGQLVPEWKEAFVDYKQLKKDLKKIHLLSNHNTSNEQQKSSFPNTFLQSLRKYTFLQHKQRDNRVIRVHRKLAVLASKGDLYETELLEQFADTDAAIEFFTRLDLQLNKVNQFFRMKEKEFLERGNSLKNQMEILMELKTAVKQKQAKGSSSQEEDSISGTILCDEESIKESADEEQELENSTDNLENHEVEFSDSLGSDEPGKSITMKKEEGKLRNLNILAFCKDFEEVTNKQVLPIYLKVVESSYFNSSDKALKLADEVEELFVKHFGGDDRRKAMKYLKPTQRKESHCVTFSIGLFTGCFLALLVGYVIMAHITGMYGPRSDAMYMETVYPVLRQVLEIFKNESMFSLLFLHFFLYGCNIVMWRKTRINHSFIFELSSTKELKYSDVFLICTTSMAAVIGILFVHLSLVAKGYSYAHVQAIPGLLFLCARRWFDEGHKSHLVNLGKYVSAMLAAGAKVAYEKEKSTGWLCLLVVVSSGATLYQLYWDFVKDWGLLQLNSKNPWLRDELMLRRKSIYFFSMGLNLLLRLAWLQTVFHYNFEKVDYRVTMLFLAALEVVRRGQWNFYRLENEHLNNAGKYRAVKTVPLPFHEVDDEQD